MCGIVGAFDLREQRVFDPVVLHRMAQSVAHRGPDDSFAFLEPGIAMATQRLAIVDVEGGRQPLADPEKRVIASQNGEIFNASELRQELIQKGYSFRSTCDTEIWPSLFLSERHNAFLEAKGQFAVAIWDRRARSLYLGRDRIGICPLYYAVADGFLLWASEIKALLASKMIVAQANLSGLDHVFNLFAAGTKQTAFRDIFSLWPGHYLHAQHDSYAIHRYWDLSFPKAGEERKGVTKVLCDELEDQITRSVSKRLVSDGSIAGYLSGGLDSTLITAIVRRLVPHRKWEAFTVGFENAGIDERERSQKHAAALGVSLHTLVCDSADILETLPELILATEGPVMDMATTCLLRLAKLVRSHGHKVVCTGEGADEAMGGYVWHKTAKILAALGNPKWFRRFIWQLATPFAPQDSFSDYFDEMYPGLLDLYEPLSKGRFLFYSPALATAIRPHNPFTELDISVEKMKDWAPLHQGLYLEYKLMLPGHLLLAKGDRVAMNAGVETRYPFLDEDFIEYTSQLAPEYKLRGLTEKWLLREVARRLFPKQIRTPPKGMFRAKSLCQLHPQPKFIKQLLSPESLRQTGYFSVEKVAHEQKLQQLLPTFHPHRMVADGSFSALVTTQLWHHLFLGGGLCDLPPYQPPQTELPFSSSQLL